MKFIFYAWVGNKNLSNNNNTIGFHPFCIVHEEINEGDDSYLQTLLEMPLYSRKNIRPQTIPGIKIRK